MKILFHDYSGHLPQVQISREMARRGHEVLHLYPRMNPNPKGIMKQQNSNDPLLRIVSIGMNKRFEKYKYIKRQIQEIEYSKPLIENVKNFCPDLVICSDTPLLPLARLQSLCVRKGVPFVFWVGDLRGVAIQNWLSRRIPLFGYMLGSVFVKLERHLMRKSNHVVLFSDNFLQAVKQRNLTNERITSLPFWAPSDDIPLRLKDNVWSREKGLVHTTNLIYAGTLGISHSPTHFVALARRLTSSEDVRIVVISQGPSVHYLESEKKKYSLDNLILLEHEPFIRLPDMLGAADILLVVLDEDAAGHSAPSKIMSHFCAGRPQLAIMPAENSLARTIMESGGGIVVHPSDSEGLVLAAKGLINDLEARRKMGRNARLYAEIGPNIQQIGKVFESIIQPLVNRKSNSVVNGYKY